MNMRLPAAWLYSIPTLIQRHYGSICAWVPSPTKWNLLLFIRKGCFNKSSKCGSTHMYFWMENQTSVFIPPRGTLFGTPDTRAKKQYWFVDLCINFWLLGFPYTNKDSQYCNIQCLQTYCILRITIFFFIMQVLLMNTFLCTIWMDDVGHSIQ